jgi:8-oxo-dGTP pyrophosphatase MutT (NUDIX family)
MPTIHPRKDNHGKQKVIDHPHKPSELSAWGDHTQQAVVVPDGTMPTSMHGIVFGPWLEAPTDRPEWTRTSGSGGFEEPPFDAKGMESAAGAVVIEPDGRVWLVAPTNAFGGYKATFPKGKTKGMDLRATAIKETHEESGLRVELFAHLTDVTRSSSRTRYYLARRIGGNPAEMCWESQAVMLSPVEDLKGLLNKSVDHKVVDALVERWGEWAGWFHRGEAKDPDFEDAASGRLPAQRHHWCTLPMPKGRVTIPLDICLNREEAECLKLGFIPRMMEQKWFAYFEANTLFEHRSWTGFCISQVHFVQDGDGLRATHAEVNRTLGQYSCTDDREDQRLITERLQQLAHMSHEDRNQEDPFVAGLKQALVLNSLGNPEVVKGLLDPFFMAILQKRIALSKPMQEGLQDAYKEETRLNTLIAKAFAGEDPDYPVIGTWHSSGNLGAAAIGGFDLDPDYYADENLFCILTEGLAGVSIRVTEMAKAFEQDPGGDLKHGLLPQLGEVLHFVSSVLMGTQSVFFPGRSLKTFTYTPTQES